MLCVRSPLPSPAGSEISVGAPSPPPRREYHRSGDDYFQPLKKLKLNENRKRSVSPPSPIPKSNIERVKSFSIADILGHKEDAANNKKPEPEEMHENFMPHRPTAIAETPKFVHPWDPFRGGLPVQPFISPALFHYDPRIAFDYQRQLEEHFHMQAQILRHMNMTEIIPSESGSERSTSAASNCCSPEIANRLSADSHQSGHSLDDLHSPNARSSSSKDLRNSNESNSNGGQKQTNPNGTPLDALFQMTNKNFDESQDESNANLFSNRPQTKKKRKSRTAFTNHQIFGLEKRFLYQKYLSPVDRDEIAASLGLSGAQVITWFQNRRAKLKRDIEELKKDVESAKVLGTAPKGFMDNINELSRLNKNPLETAMSA